MKHLVFMCITTVLALPALAQNMSWVNGLGSSASDMVEQAAVDAAGNVYSVGQFRGVVDFDPGPGTYTLSSGNTNSNGFVLKLDASGNFVWAVNIGSTGFDFAHSVALDAAGNAYVCGSFEGNVDMDPGPATYTLSAGNRDAFVLKLDPLGNFLWAGQIGGSLFEYAYTVVIDPAGDMLLNGHFSGTVDFDPGPGTYTMSGTGMSQDIFVCKLTASGSFIWAKAMGGSQDEAPLRMAIDAAGNIYSTGFFEGTIDLDPGPGASTFTAGNSLGNGFVNKLDATGNFIWASVYQGSGSCWVHDVTIAPGGDLVLSGFYSGVIDFDPGPAVTNFTSQGAIVPTKDSFVIRMDANGNGVWNRFFTSPSYNESLAATVDAAGNIFVSGRFTGLLDVDPGPAAFQVANTPGEDIYLVKLDGSGSLVSAYTAGSTGADVPLSIIKDASGNFYMTGYYSNPISFGFGFVLPGSFNNDGFIIKFQDCSTALLSQPAGVAVGINDQALFIAGPAQLGATYQWQEYNGSITVNLSNGPNYSGVTSPSLSVTASLAHNGNTYRCLISNGSCTVVSAAATLTVNNNTGIIPRVSAAALSIYPNPAGNAIYLSAAGTQGNYSISDPSGRVVQQGVMAGGGEIRIDGLSKGLYFLQLEGSHYGAARFLKD